MLPRVSLIPAEPRGSLIPVEPRGSLILAEPKESQIPVEPREFLIPKDPNPMNVTHSYAYARARLNRYPRILMRGDHSFVLLHKRPLL